MVIVRDIEVCPTCNQTINSRRVPLSYQMVRALFHVYRYCLTSNRNEFQRKEIDKLLRKGTEYANWGYWKWWSAGLVYTPTDPNTGKKKGRGWWGLNLERCKEFFDGKRTVSSLIWVKGKGKQRQYEIERTSYISEIPDISVFLEGDDEYKEYVAQYK